MGRILVQTKEKIMARDQANASEARELTEAELDAVSGGGTWQHQDEGPTEDITFVYGKLG